MTRSQKLPSKTDILNDLAALDALFKIERLGPGEYTATMMAERWFCNPSTAKRRMNHLVKTGQMIGPLKRSLPDGNRVQAWAMKR